MADQPEKIAADLTARLQRLEEAHGFSEHAVEQLSAEVAELNKRLAEAVTRIRTLEVRLQQMLEPLEDAGEERNDCVNLSRADQTD